MISIARRAMAELVGTGLFMVALVGSGIMAEGLAGNPAVALIVNGLAMGAALAALLMAMAPISGACFNPAVTVVLAARGRMTMRDAAILVVAQLVGAVAGVVWAHAMFGLPLLQIATHARSGIGASFSEFTATFGLVMLVEAGRRHFATALPAAIAVYVTAAYWFTSSTSLANPAASAARVLTGTFAGAAVSDAIPFIIAQALGAAVAAVFARWLLRPIAT